MARLLTPKQQRFVQEYLIDCNATQAAIRAGYAARNADVTGPRLLRNAGVAAAVSRAQSRLVERVEITTDAVVKRLWFEATREGEGASHGARVAALTQLARHLGMFDKDNAQKNPFAGLPREVLREVEEALANALCARRDTTSDPGTRTH